MSYMEDPPVKQHYDAKATLEERIRLRDEKVVRDRAKDDFADALLTAIRNWCYEHAATLNAQRIISTRTSRNSIDMLVPTGRGDTVRHRIRYEPEKETVYIGTPERSDKEEIAYGISSFMRDSTPEEAAEVVLYGLWLRAII